MLFDTLVNYPHGSVMFNFLNNLAGVQIIFGIKIVASKTFSEFVNCLRNTIHCNYWGSKYRINILTLFFCACLNCAWSSIFDSMSGVHKACVVLHLLLDSFYGMNITTRLHVSTPYHSNNKLIP